MWQWGISAIVRGRFRNGREGHLWTKYRFSNLDETGKVSLPTTEAEDFPIAHRSEFAVERRKGIRYRMNASVLFRWSGPEEEHCQGEGITRDMSVSGAYIVTATCPPPNAVIRMEVFLPISDGGSKALMQADMMVLRVEHDSEGNPRSGFSAVGKGFSLRTLSGRASRPTSSFISEPEEFAEGE